MKKAIIESLFWIFLSVLFGIGVLFTMGDTVGYQWFTTYTLEKMLSFDNLFVFYLIFKYFDMPNEIQHRCLFWGIIGVVLLRGIFILSGVAILSNFHFVIYLLGAFLIWTGIKMLKSDDDFKVEDSSAYKFVSKHLKIHPKFEGSKFFHNGLPTKLFLALIIIELTDVVFAIDSVPAALGVSTDFFIVFSSNLFAIMGLRAMYFVVKEVIEKFWALNYAVSIILSFIGVKMIIQDFVHIPELILFSFTILSIIISVVVSLMHPKKVENKIKLDTD